MRDDLPPTARVFMQASGSILCGLGAAMWVLGQSITFLLGLNFCGLFSGSSPWSYLFNLGWLLASVIMQMIGSGMYFLTKSWIADQPDQIPTEILPKWWLAKFSTPLCAGLFASFLVASIRAAFQIDPLAIPSGLIASAALKGFVHYKHQTVELSPTYPPRSGPPKWETRG